MVLGFLFFLSEFGRLGNDLADLLLWVSDRVLLLDHLWRLQDSIGRNLLLNFYLHRLLYHLRLLNLHRLLLNLVTLHVRHLTFLCLFHTYCIYPGLLLIIPLFDNLDISVLIKLLVCFEVELPVFDAFPYLSLGLPLLLDHYIAVFKCLFFRIFQHRHINHRTSPPNTEIPLTREHRQALPRLPTTELR